MTDTTLETQDVSRMSDEKSEDEEKGGVYGFSCCLCQSSCWQLLCLGIAMAAVFAVGLLIGMSTKRLQNTNSINALESAVSTQPPSQPNEGTPASPSDLLVGAYYYPRHGSNFHNGGGYMRNQLEPPQMPALGEYDDSKAETIAQHLKWSRQANIGLWVTSWWGPNLLEDRNTRDIIMEHEDLGDLKIAIHYKSTGRIRDEDMDTVKSDIEYLCERYFDHPNYYRIEGRPVIYVTRVLEQRGVLAAAVLRMRSVASKCGYNIYLIGDHVFQDAPDDLSQTYLPFLYFDAVTNYDMYGSMGSPTYYAGADVVDAYYRKQDAWRTLAIENGCRFIPAVSPGFNDRGVRLQGNHPPLSRSLTSDSEQGSLFSYTIQKAKKLVDPKIDNLLLVNSFNEWHEDSQIEPTMGEPTTFPEILTGGVEYIGYGELYLNLLREGTKPEAPQTQQRNNVFGNPGA
jgi:glycoprotein endo-alpha-1,2-mannosidase